jgi:hypothetical protein
MRKNRHNRRAGAAQSKANGPDPFGVYMNAERFRIADSVLRQDANVKQFGSSIGGPTLVIATLAAELYLKCLFIIETGRPSPDIHELRKLFLLLSDGARAEIEAVWDDYSKHPQTLTIYDAVENMTGFSIPRDLRWHLRAGNEAFVKLRYSHEPQNANVKFFLGDFHLMVRQTILRRRPEWANIVHTPAEEITRKLDPTEPK